MENSTAAKLPPSGNVIYDSRKDTLTGKKRAVIPGGGASVAERARLFGTQITISPSKTQQTQRPPINQSFKSNAARQDQNYQPSKSNVTYQDQNYHRFNSSADRHPKPDVAYSTPQRVSYNLRSPLLSDIRAKRGQPSSTDFSGYATVRRPITRQIPPSHDQDRNSSTRYQPSSSYDNFQRTISQQASRKTNHTQRSTDESHLYDPDPYLELNNRQKPRNTPDAQSSNYFRPIDDPLELLLNDSSQNYSIQQAPRQNETDSNGLQPFNLGNLINRIQQDYLKNAQPYVSSIQYVQTDRSLADIGFITPASTRKRYTNPTQDLNRQQGPSDQYDYIDTNGFDRYTKRNPKQSYTDNRYSSMDRRKHKIRYHDQASSPIHMPVAPIPKPPSPPTIHSTDEEEDTATISQPAPALPITESESSTASEDESLAKPSTTPSLSKPVAETTPAPVITETSASQRSGITRPALPNQASSTIPRTPAKKIESEESETEESDTDTVSESESEDEKPTAKPLPVARTNNQQATPGTPNTRSATTPQLNARAVPQRNNTNDNNRNQIPEPTNSIHSFEPEGEEEYEYGKPSSIGGKLKSLKNKFRRKKSQ